jgi:hypothetical protein
VLAREHVNSPAPHASEGAAIKPACGLAVRRAPLLVRDQKPGDFLAQQRLVRDAIG